MSSEKMREEFEAAYTQACLERGAGHHIAEVHTTKGSSGEYVSVWMRGAWWAWQASRAALLKRQAQEQEEFIAQLADFEHEDTFHG